MPSPALNGSCSSRPLVIKVSFNRTNFTKRISFVDARQVSWELFRQKIGQCFSLAQPFHIAYTDDDGDETEISNPDDLSEAVTYFSDDTESSLASSTDGITKITMRVFVLVDYDGPNLSDAASLTESLDDRGSGLGLYPWHNRAAFDRGSDKSSPSSNGRRWRDEGRSEWDSRSRPSSSDVREYRAGPRSNSPTSSGSSSSGERDGFHSRPWRDDFPRKPHMRGRGGGHKYPRGHIQRRDWPPKHRGGDDWSRPHSPPGSHREFEPHDEHPRHFSHDRDYLHSLRPATGRSVQEYTSVADPDLSSELEAQSSSRSRSPRRADSHVFSSNGSSRASRSRPVSPEASRPNQKGMQLSHSPSSSGTSTTSNFRASALGRLNLPPNPPRPFSRLSTVPDELLRCSGCSNVMGEIRYVCDVCGPFRPAGEDGDGSSGKSDNGTTVETPKTDGHWPKATTTTESADMSDSSAGGNGADGSAGSTLADSLDEGSAGVGQEDTNAVPQTSASEGSGDAPAKSSDPQASSSSASSPLLVSLPTSSVSSTSALEEEEDPLEHGYELCPACVESVGLQHANKMASRPRTASSNEDDNIEVKHAFEEVMRDDEGVWKEVNYENGHETFCTICGEGPLEVDRFKCCSCASFELCLSCYRRVDEIHPIHTFLAIADRPAKWDDSPEYFPSQADSYGRIEPWRPSSSPKSFRHPDTMCLGCLREIVGPRYRCSVCRDLDLCEECEAQPLGFLPSPHTPSHIMLKISVPVSPDSIMMASEKAHVLREDPNAFSAGSCGGRRRGARSIGGQSSGSGGSRRSGGSSGEQRAGSARVREDLRRLENMRRMENVRRRQDALRIRGNGMPGSPPHPWSAPPAHFGPWGHPSHFGFGPPPPPPPHHWNGRGPPHHRWHSPPPHHHRRGPPPPNIYLVNTGIGGSPSHLSAPVSNPQITSGTPVMVDQIQRLAELDVVEREREREKWHLHQERCQGCDKFIMGIRWLCAQCPTYPSYDLCSDCEASSAIIHNPQHCFIRLPRPLYKPLPDVHKLLPVLYAKRVGGLRGDQIDTNNLHDESLVHPSVICDNCSEPVRGAWFRCANGCSQNNDFCGNCLLMKAPTHDFQHVFIKFARKVDMQVFRELVGLGKGQPKPLIKFTFYD